MRRAIPFLVTLTLLGGCFTLPPGPGPDLSSPYSTLKYLADSYAVLDPDFLYQILADDYRFAFDYDDWGDTVGDYRIPQDGIWYITSERIATQNLLNTAQGITIYLDFDAMEPLPEGASRYSSGPLQYAIRYYYDEEYNHFDVNGYASFDMRKDADDNWLITRWGDEKYDETAYSWGWLKALYRLH
jgi:hypothetical protein